LVLVDHKARRRPGRDQPSRRCVVSPARRADRRSGAGAPELPLPPDVAGRRDDGSSRRRRAPAGM